MKKYFLGFSLLSILAFTSGCEEIRRCMGTDKGTASIEKGACTHCGGTVCGSSCKAHTVTDSTKATLKH